jgi:BRCA1-associated protein
LSHARQHYDDTLHAYALDTETQHVWDFAGQGYVHRLLQNSKDGKLVEVNDPHNTSQERSLSPGLSDAQEEQVVHRKLEGFASQYYTLLKSQLEQQRIYYESRLEEIRRECGRGRHGKKSGSASADLISVLKQERNQLAQRCMTLRQRYEKISDDVTFLRNMNESLEANKAPLKRQITDAQRQRAEARDMIQQCLPPMEEKVTMLMLQLEESMNAKAEVEQAPSRHSMSDKKPVPRP